MPFEWHHRVNTWTVFARATIVFAMLGLVASGNTVENLMSEGDRAFNAGNAEEAYAKFAEATTVDPAEPAAWFNLGSVAHTLQRYADAVRAYQHVIDLSPSSSEGHFYLGYSLHIGRVDLALAREHYEKSQQLKPEAWDETRQGMLQAVIAELQHARADDPEQTRRGGQESSTASANPGNSEQQNAAPEGTRRTDARSSSSPARGGEAEKKTPTKKKKTTPTKRITKAMLLEFLDRSSDPLRYLLEEFDLSSLSEPFLIKTATGLEKSAAIDRGIEVLCLGLLVNTKSVNLFEALVSMMERHGLINDHLRSIRPQQYPWSHPVSYNNLAAHLVNSRPPVAEHLLRVGIEMNSDLGELRLNLGDSLWQQAFYSPAIEQYLGAMTAGLSGAYSWHHLGNALFHAYRYAQAAECYKNALNLDPQYSESRYQLASVQSLLAQWDEDYDYNLHHASTQLTNFLSDNPKKDSPLSPMQATLFPLSTETYLKLTHRVMRRSEEAVKRSGRPPYDHRGALEKVLHSGRSERRLRVGYVSADFRTHPVGKLDFGLFVRHNKSRVEVFCYNILVPGKGVNAPRGGDPINQQVREHADHFIDLHSLSGEQAAARIKADNIDILVDLQNYSVFGRVEIFAFRPAPVQVTWMGFMSTSGAHFYDYIITDHVTSPPPFQGDYVEHFAYLPPIFYVCSHKLLHPEFDVDDARDIPKHKTRTQLGLPADGIVFEAFNRLEKVPPENFAIWCEILEQVPGSVLWIMKSDGAHEAEDNIRRHLDRRFGKGHLQDRIIFIPFQRDRHLQIEAHGDVFLDSWRYSGGSTSLDVTWAGVPVVTYPGRNMWQRMTASHLSGLNMTELIAHSPQEYRDIAVRLAKDKAFRERMKGRLHASKREGGNVWDLDTYVSRFERNLQAMYEVRVLSKKIMHLF